MKIYNKDKIVSVKIYREKVCEDIVYRDELRILWGKILLREEGYYDYSIKSYKIDDDIFKEKYIHEGDKIYKKAFLQVRFTNEHCLTMYFSCYQFALKYAHTLIEDKNKIIVE